MVINLVVGFIEQRTIKYQKIAKIFLKVFFIGRKPIYLHAKKIELYCINY